MTACVRVRADVTICRKLGRLRDGLVVREATQNSQSFVPRRTLCAVRLRRAAGGSARISGFIRRRLCLWMSGTQFGRDGVAVNTTPVFPDTPPGSSGPPRTRGALNPLQKLVLYSRNKASRRQMSSTLPSLPPGQMAKLDNMLSKITLQSHGHVSVCPAGRAAWQAPTSLPGCGVCPGRGEARVGGGGVV